MERQILLLGLLRKHPMYGYQINEMIDSHLGTSVRLTKPTAYRILDQMAGKGWIKSKVEREGKRPSRRVYSITIKGELQFRKDLRESLGGFQPFEFRSAISLGFLDDLPRKEAVALLRNRRLIVENMLSVRGTGDDHHGGFRYIIDHTVCHLKAELQWLDRILSRLKES